MKMRKLLSILLALIMLLGVVPSLVLGISAEEETGENGSESTAVTVTNGDYSLTVNKTHFEVGEDILVSATGVNSNDWVAIYAANQENYIYWQYIRTVGAGTTFNIKNAQAGNSSADLRQLPEGRYVVRLVKSDNNLANTPCYVIITIGNPPAIMGNSSVLNVEKTTYTPGEKVMVSGKISNNSNDWIGIYAINSHGTTYSNMWKYIANVGEDVEFDVTNGANLPLGDYILCQIENNSSRPTNATAWTIISVVEETTEPEDPNPEDPNPEDPNPEDPNPEDPNPDDPNPEDPDPEEPEQDEDTASTVVATNGTHSLGVNKTKYAVGEKIWVTATGVSSKDWIGIAERDSTVGTIRWYYVADVGNGVAYNIKEASNIGGNLAHLSSLPEGLYTIYLVENDQYLKNDFTLSINISVGDVEDSDNGKTFVKGVQDTTVPSAPTGAVYDIANGTDGYAKGTVTVTMPQGEVDNRAILMYWADAQGKLEGYTSHARFKVTGETTTYTFTSSMIIPSGATHLYVYSQNITTGELSDEYISVELPKDAQMEITETPKTSFFIISDIHIGGSTSANNFKKMLKEAITLNPNGTAIFIVGDMADNGVQAQYEEMLSLHSAVMAECGKDAKDYPLFLTLGNHDYPAMASLFLQYATLPNGEHPTDTSYDFWLNGYHYIFLASDTNAGLYANLTEETLAWLDTKLNECRDESRPTFVFLHQPMYNTVSGSLPGEGWNGVNNEEALRTVLAKYPEVMLFNGHTHWTMDSTGNIFEGTDELPIHIFNCASVSYLWSGFNYVTGENLVGSQGYYIEIYDGRVVVRGRDFMNSAWISAAQYCVEMTQGEENEAHSYINTAISYENGYLKAGVLTSVCSTCGTEKTTEANPIIVFKGYSISTFNTSSICVGYVIDYELLEKYEAINQTTITLGIVASPYDSLTVQGKPINPDGTVSTTTSGQIAKMELVDTHKYVDLILRSSDWTSYADKKVILCVYIIENEEVGYVCSEEAVSESASYITYNGLKATLGE